jgi:hypothetical protein
MKPELTFRVPYREAGKPVRLENIVYRTYQESWDNYDGIWKHRVNGRTVWPIMPVPAKAAHTRRYHRHR